MLISLVAVLTLVLLPTTHASCLGGGIPELCAGHGTCSGTTCVCSDSTWGGEFCHLAQEVHMWPAVGDWSGSTDVALVLYDLNLDPYIETQGDIAVVLHHGEGVLRYEIVCDAYAMRTPWEHNPGAALGWAATAPTYMRQYGEGYHIYDDNQTKLELFDDPKKNRTVAIEWRSKTPQSGKPKVYNVAIRLQTPSGPVDYNLDPSQYQYEFHTGTASFASISPKSAGYDGTTQVSVVGSGFHQAGTPYPGTPALKNTIVRVTLSPRHKEPWWESDKSFYPNFTMSADGTTILFTMPQLPMTTANMSVAVEVTRNRQEFIRAWGQEISLTNIATFEKLEPQVVDRSHLTSYSLVPLGAQVEMVITGTGFVNTSLIRAVGMSTFAGAVLPANEIIGSADVDFVNSTFLRLTTPAFPIKHYHFPPQSCPNKASQKCLCDSWEVNEPTWNLDGNTCCLQPFEDPKADLWCYCQINPLEPNKKVRQYVWQFCDRMFEKVPTFDILMIVALNHSFGDYVRHPLRLSLYAPPNETRLEPSSVPFSHTRRIDITGEGFMNTNLLKGRLFIAGSISPVDVTYVDPRLIYFWTPTWTIQNASVAALVEITMNGVNWHRMGSYVYEIPVYSHVEPGAVDANGGGTLTIVGQNFMNITTMKVRFRTSKGLASELSDLQAKLSHVQDAIAHAATNDEALRLAAYETDVFNATILRREMMEAREKAFWPHDLRRRPTREYLDVLESIVQRKLAQTQQCIVSEHTFVVPATWVSEKRVTVVMPRLCLSETDVLVEVDLVHEPTYGEAGYQHDILHFHAFNQSLLDTPQNPEEIQQHRQQVSFADGGYATIGMFSGIMTTGPHGEVADHTDVCKYLDRGREKFRYAGMGVYKTDPHAQVPQALFDPTVHGNWKTQDLLTDYDVIHCHQIPRQLLKSKGLRDGVLTRYTHWGAIAWSVRMGGTLDDHLTAMNVDRYDNIYVAGHFSGPGISFTSKMIEMMADIDQARSLDTAVTHNSTQVRKLFVSKYDSQGRLKLAVEVAACVHTRDMCHIQSINSDQDENIFVTGLFFGVATFGSVCASPPCKTYVQPAAVSGEPRKHEHWADTCDSNPPNCHQIPRVRLASTEQCTLQYNSKGRQCSGDAFVAMLDPMGDLVWVKNINTNSTWYRHTQVVEPTRGIVEVWSNRTYYKYLESGTLHTKLEL